MDRSHFLTHLDDLFQLEDGAIRPETVIREIDGWSTLTLMGLIAVVDDEYGVTLSPGVIAAAKTVGDLWYAINLAKTGAAAA